MMENQDTGNQGEMLREEQDIREYTEQQLYLKEGQVRLEVL